MSKADERTTKLKAPTDPFPENEQQISLADIPAYIEGLREQRDRLAGAAKQLLDSHQQPDRSQRMAARVALADALRTADCNPGQALLVRNMTINALRSATHAAEQIIRVCEADMEAGRSPSPFTRSNPSGALAQCYAATCFVSEARAALVLWRQPK